MFAINVGCPSETDAAESTSDMLLGRNDIEKLNEENVFEDIG